MSDTPSRAYHDRLRLPWRVFFVIYSLAMTTGTHWPRLRLHGSIPASDKVIHTIAFCGLTVLLWRTGWVASKVWLAIIMVTWAAIDETTQLFPGLGRFFSPEDYLSNFLGIAVALTWLWALGPAGSNAARRRHRVVRGALDRACSRWSTWGVGLVIVIACVVPLLAMWTRFDPGRTGAPTLVAFLAIVTLLTLSIADRFTPERRAMQVGRLCPDCGHTCAIGPVAEPRRCPGCEALWPEDTWAPAPRLRPNIAAVLIAATAVVLAVVIVSVPSRWLGGLPDHMRGVLALVLAAAGVGIAIGLTRRMATAGGD